MPLLVILAVLAGIVRGNLTSSRPPPSPTAGAPRTTAASPASSAPPPTSPQPSPPWAGAALAGPLGGYAHLFAALAALSLISTILTVICPMKVQTARNWG